MKIQSIKSCGLGVVVTLLVAAAYVLAGKFGKLSFITDADIFVQIGIGILGPLTIGTCVGLASSCCCATEEETLEVPSWDEELIEKPIEEISVQRISPPIAMAIDKSHIAACNAWCRKHYYGALAKGRNNSAHLILTARIAAEKLRDQYKLPDTDYLALLLQHGYTQEKLPLQLLAEIEEASHSLKSSNSSSFSSPQMQQLFQQKLAALNDHETAKSEMIDTNMAPTLTDEFGSGEQTPNSSCTPSRSNSVTATPRLSISDTPEITDEKTTHHDETTIATATIQNRM